MSIADEAEAEAESRYLDIYGSEFDPDSERRAFVAGAEWQASRKPEAAPSEPSVWGAGLVAPGGSSGPQSAGDRDAVEESLGKSFVAAPSDPHIGVEHEGYCHLQHGLGGKCSCTSQPVQVTRGELADAMIASDALSDDVRAEARVAGSSQREPFLMFADAVMPFVAQPVQVEVTEAMVEKALNVYRMRTAERIDVGAFRAALSAALGGW